MAGEPERGGGKAPVREWGGARDKAWRSRAWSG